MSFGIPVRNGLGVGLLASTSLSTVNGAAFTPASLFAAGEPGAWYDPSDFSTLFQDAAGTTPVTAVEQYVGLMLDKSGRGNHTTQSTSAARPQLRALYNLLTYTEQFDNAAWVKVNSGSTSPVVTANQAIAPDGTTTADEIAFGAITTAGGYSVIYQAPTGASAVRLASIYVKAKSAGDVGKKIHIYTNSVSDVSVYTLTADWQRISSPAASAQNPDLQLGALGSSFSGGGNQGAFSCYVWGADLRVANDGVNLPPYQRVAAAGVYDTTGFPPYLSFDGSDDSMSTATITPGIDKAQVFAGVRKLSDAAPGLVCELSSDSFANNGTIAFQAPGTGATYFWRSRGTSSASGATSTDYTSPLTSVSTGLGDIAADVSKLRYNGVQILDLTADQGTGNYLAYPLYIGRRGGTTLSFNGRIYSLILRFGANLTDTQIAQTESYVSTQMGGGYVPVGYDYLVDANGDQLTDASGNALYTIPLYS